jgi:transcriptional regulator with XRE-family HTH domain
MDDKKAAKTKIDKRRREFLKAFGEHVKKVRTATGYSQDKIYLEGNLSRATMSRVERGEVDVQIFTLFRISKTIGVPLRKLTDFEWKSDYR